LREKKGRWGPKMERFRKKLNQKTGEAKENTKGKEKTIQR